MLKVDFAGTSDDMKTTLSAYISAIELTINSITLEQFLRLVLRIGNFMNKVSEYLNHSLCHNDSAKSIFTSTAVQQYTIYNPVSNHDAWSALNCTMDNIFCLL